MSVVISHLSKIFGEQKAVDDISFTANEGVITGFLGPNGAGKSTTMKIATTYLPPTSGTVTVNGIDVLEDPVEVRKNVGYLPENNPLYYDMYVKEYLRFIGGLRKISGKELEQRIGEIIEKCGLIEEQRKLVGDLSKGYRQRVGLAQVLLHDPKVMILDEPTTGLDPNQILEIRKLIKEMSKEKTVLLSTHIMQEVKAICDRVVVINKGKIVADDSIEDLSKKFRRKQIIEIEFSDKIDTEQLKSIQGVIEVTESGSGKNIYIIEASSEVDVRSDIFNHAGKQKVSLIGMQQKEASIEEIFHELTVEQEEQ